MFRPEVQRPALLRTGVLVRLGALLVALAVAVPGGAQDRERLVRVLHGSRDFRVRVQAAFALGNSDDARFVRPLARALARDDSAAVRAAAATALGRLGSPRALPALRKARRDRASAVRIQANESIRALERRGASSERVRRRSRRARPRRSSRYPAVAVAPRADRVVWSRVRYVVALGEMRNGSGFSHDALPSLLKTEVSRNLGLLRGVHTFDAKGGLDAEAQKEVRRRRLSVLRIEGNVAEVQPRVNGGNVSVRAKVSLMVLKEPDRTMQSLLSGAATGSAPRIRDARAQRRKLAEQALAGAVRSAMSGVTSALASAAR